MDKISLKEFINLKNCLVEAKLDHIKEVSDLKSEFQKEISQLQWRLSEVAINKQETAMNDRMENSNNKFALLKEQATEFATKKDIESIKENISVLQKIVYIGLGGVLLLEAISKFILK